jgi:hypothetical protein
VTGSVVGRDIELEAIRQELASAKAGRLAVVTLEGEPGIGKTRLLLAASEVATAEGCTSLAVTADEEIRGPFLLARAIFATPAAREAAAGTAAEEPLERALDAISGHDDPTLERLSPDQKLLRVFDLAALAICSLAAVKPLAILLDDLQWADEDSVRMLRYVVRTDADRPIFLALATRTDELSFAGESATLIADMERLGIVRRLKIARFTQLETTEFLKQLLAGDVNVSSAASMHAQSEGVAFIVEELARSYRDAALLQEIDGAWTLAPNAERLVPSAVRTLIQRRTARLPEETRATLAEAAILGRSFSLTDLRAVKLQLGEGDERAAPTVLAEALAPAVASGLLVMHQTGSPADYSFTHDQVREFASAALTPPRRRNIHTAIVDMIAGDGEPPAASVSLLAHHAIAAGDHDRAVRFSISAAAAALQARAPDEVLRIVDEALPIASAAHERVRLLTARDDALHMLRRASDRLEGLAELGALAEALGDSHLELRVMLRRAAALRFAEEEGRAAELARKVAMLAHERGDGPAELTACLELGQALLGSPLGESFSPPASEVDLDGAEEAYGRACSLAQEVGDLAAVAAATRELGVIGVSRIREWFLETVREGNHTDIVRRVAAGDTSAAILADLPIVSLVQKSVSRYERAAELFEQVGDRRGVMSSIIALAYLKFGFDIHLRGSASRIEEIRRLAGQMTSLTQESERATAEAQMLYGVHVFARAKVVPDLALARGEEGYQHARMLGDRSLEFAVAAGVALTHVELGDLEQASRWLDRAAAAAAAAPTPLRARQLETWRGLVAAAAGDAAEMREHLQRAVRLATEQGRPAGRCEALASLALEAAWLGAERRDEELLALAERSAKEARELTELLPGHPPWRARADAALARTALARGSADAAANAARSALRELEEIHREDLLLDIVLPAAAAILAGGSGEEKEAVRERLRTTAVLIAQRITDEDVRVRWFRGPVGRELSRLTEPPAKDGAATDVGESDALAWLLIAGCTNDEIASKLGVSEDVVVRRLAEMYAKAGLSSPAEGAVFGLREQEV